MGKHGFLAGTLQVVRLAKVSAQCSINARHFICLLLTFLGFHLMTLPSPYCWARPASLCLSKVSCLANEVTFSSPFSAVCDCVLPTLSCICGALSRAREHCRSTILFPIKYTPSASCLDSFPVSRVHTKKCQSIVEASPRMIKALVSDSQPLQLFRQHLISIMAKHLPIRLIQHSRVFVDEERSLLERTTGPYRHCHSPGSLLPSWALCAVDVRFVRCRTSSREGGLL